MTSQFEHLQLPKTNIEMPRRSTGGGFGRRRRDNRSSHGKALLDQASTLLDRPPRQHTPFGINPKLIFKLKLREGDSLQDDEVIRSGLNILAKGNKSDQAIVVFPSDDDLTEFRKRLESYSDESESSHQYGYIDAIEELVPLQPEDRIGRLLELEPLEPGELVPLDLELWHTGNREEMQQCIQDLDHFLRDFQEYPEMRVTDRYIGEYLCIARIKIRQEVLEILLDYDAVKEIDRRPRPAFESSSQLSVPVSEFPEVMSPPIEAFGVLVIDSGVQRGHPLIAPALGDAEVFPDPNYTFITGGPDDGDQTNGGHGTGVSGVAIYGDVRQSFEERSFQPEVWLFSARVTNENNEYDPDLLLENQLENAIDYFTRNYPNCKVINISLGDSTLVYREGEKQFRLAAKIDEIAYRLQNRNILFVISAGNFKFYDQVDSKELLRQDYPRYLTFEESRILEPATAAIALTVGSLSMGTGSCQYPDDAQRNAIAKIEGYPSPFTRTGFGVDGMVKPDLVDFGGDLILDGTRVIKNEIGVCILTLAKNYQGSLFRVFSGTSFAAPRVANLAAKLFNIFPNATPNLIRALIADSANLPDEIPPDFQADEKLSLRIYGYGQPNFEKAAYSTENEVILLEDNRIITVGNFEIYEIPPLPNEFLEVQGSKKISVTLAFDPPTRHTRGDSYLGVTMEFNLFRNIDIESLRGAFQKVNKEDNAENIIEVTMEELKKKHGSSIKVDLQPGVNTRKKGTLQKGSIEISSKTWKYNYESMYVVISCSRKWAKKDEIEMQRYALVVSVRHSNPQVDLYNRLRQQTRVAQRVRIR